MALLDTVKNKVTGLLTPAKLEKAKIIALYSESGMGPEKATTFTVQFNPAEYVLERRVHLSRRRKIGEDQKPAEPSATASEPATLSLSLYFDTITDLHSQSLSGLKNSLDQNGLAQTAKTLAVDQFWRASNDNPAFVAEELTRLVKYVNTRHQPPQVRFVWGRFDFLGKVVSATIQYTMFSPAGTPVRARVNLTLQGEEQITRQAIAQKPPESPDRTKERALAQGDQLWMIAGQEYSDPGKWKLIAQANGILNPRTLERAASLKVPSIK